MQFINAYPESARSSVEIHRGTVWLELLGDVDGFSNLILIIFNLRSYQ